MSNQAATFQANLEYGSAGEGRIAKWLRGRGYTVLPTYEKIIDSGKGPRLFTAGAPLIVPDLLVFNSAKAFWVEAKRKAAFTWHRKTGRWVTGIDLPHYEDYCRVNDETPWPVWLLFLHEAGRAGDSSAGCPTGLFGNSLDALRCCENHRYIARPPKMVYWWADSLRKIAELDALPGTGCAGQ